MRSDIAQAVAYTEMVAAQANYPKLKELDWWLIHPYAAFPMRDVSRTTYDWIVTHREFPKHSQANLEEQRRKISITETMKQLAQEFAAVEHTRGVTKTDNEEYFLCKGYEMGLSYEQLGFVIKKNKYYVLRQINNLAQQEIVRKRRLSKRREAL